MRRAFRYSLLLALILGGVWLFIPPRPLQTATLPDGRVLRLEKVTYGPETEVIPGGPRWRQLLWALLRPRRDSTGPPELTFWTSPAGEGDFLRGSEFFDEDGCTIQASFGGPIIGGLSPLRGTYRGYRTEIFPRHSPTIGLRIMVDEKPAAEFVVPNPAWSPRPPLQPEALPSLRKAEDLEFFLTEFRRIEAERILPFSPITRLQVEARQDGRPAPHWAPGTVRVADAVGPLRIRNLWIPPGYEVPPGVAFLSDLWPGEPAWRLTVDMVRTVEADFHPEQLWIVSGVAPVNEGSPVFLEPDRRPVEFPWTDLPDAAVTISEVMTDEMGSYLWHVAVTARTPHDDLYVSLIRAVDDQGRPANVDQRLAWHGLASNYPRRVRDRNVPQGWRFLLSVVPEENAESLTLTFAVQRAKRVEFLVAVEPLQASGG